MIYETPIDALARRIAAHDPALSEEEVDMIAVSIGDTPELTPDGKAIISRLPDGQPYQLPATVFYGEERP